VNHKFTWQLNFTTKLFEQKYLRDWFAKNETKVKGYFKKFCDAIKAGHEVAGFSEANELTK
jgi:hypothetical protein